MLGGNAMKKYTFFWLTIFFWKQNPRLKKQVERKRHIGNDIVNIVFIDSEDNEDLDFSPSFIKSQFTRILFKHLRSVRIYRI